MPRRVLITGGAGFIGSHVADELLAHGWRVRALDNLAPQVHGTGSAPPGYLDREVELQVGDVRDGAAVERALAGVEAVVHLAAVVGVGQSMYEIERYTAVNNVGTAVLLEALSRRPVARLVVASSMSVYGEGRYRAPDGSLLDDVEREPGRLRARDWEPRLGPAVLEPVPTPEEKPVSLPSIYALSKFDQERMCLLVGRAYGIPAVALRLFNIFGPRQALSNPYTGVLAIFASRLLNGRPPLINEDGLQRRDFVSVTDAACAFRLALEVPEGRLEREAPGRVFNIGSGNQYTIRSVAERMADALGKEHLRPEITGRCRAGDVRHCFPAIDLARRVLGYGPQVFLEEGVVELAGWLQGQIAVDRVEEARAQLESRGLAR